MTDDFKSLFAYNRWADDRVLAACRALTGQQYVCEPAPGWASVRATVVHIAGATRLWSRRMLGEAGGPLATEIDVPTLDEADRLYQEGHDAFDGLVATLPPDQFSALWSYRNIQGQTYTIPLWTALRHVVNHATYHRGQVAAKLKRLGAEPPKTDLILWAIEHTPQPAA